MGEGEMWKWEKMELGEWGTWDGKNERPIATPNIDWVNKNDIYNDIYQL